MFTIPNKAVTYPMQSRWFQSDVDILQGAAGGEYGVIASACEVTASVVPAMTVEIASGQVVIDGVRYTYPGETLAISDADPLLPRFDTIVVADDLSGGALVGVPDAAPFPPSPLVDQVGLAQLFIPAADTAISSGQLVDKRIGVPDPVAATTWNRVSAATDLARSNQGTRTFDSALSFAAAANTNYRVRGVFAWVVSAGSNNNSLAFGINGPVSPSFYEGVFTFAYTDTANTAGSQHLYLTNYNATILSDSGSLSAVSQGSGRFDITFLNGSTAGTFGVAWGQSFAVAGVTTRKAGSYIEYEVV